MTQNGNKALRIWKEADRCIRIQDVPAWLVDVDIMPMFDDHDFHETAKTVFRVHDAIASAL